jgi:hypothetical protein
MQVTAELGNTFSLSLLHFTTLKNDGEINIASTIPSYLGTQRRSDY